ncbi:MAG: serine hydrolase [Burkholderiales bacterium]|nr:serine hydrolase [Burkholderiales bacterium]
MHRRRHYFCLLLLAFIPLAWAQPPLQRPAGIADEQSPLMVAGWRALFTCSAHFVAGRPLEDIRRVELADVEGLGYPDPVIDAQRALVSAADAAGDIERIAAYRSGMGCTLLPPHWRRGDVPHLPFVQHAAAPDRRDLTFPQGDRVDLPQDGLDARHPALAPVLERAFDGHSYSAEEGAVTTAVIVLRQGRIIAERYRPGFGIYSGYRTWSTSKSITAALIGIAAAQGVLDMDGPADIPEWSHPGDPRQAITYRHLLWMSSGLFSGGANSTAVYFGGQDVISAATTTALEVPPGTRWQYANNDTLLLMRALRHRLNDDLRYLRYPYEQLLHRIGMHHTVMEVDHLGNFIASSQTYTTARDLARFGLLLAQDGMWQGQRVLPAGWAEFLATPAPTKPPTDGQRGYGAQFWLLDRMPGVPAGTFSTAGRKGQFVTVVPGHDVVIVRTGVDPERSRFLQERLVADVMQALAR